MTKKGCVLSFPAPPLVTFSVSKMILIASSIGVEDLESFFVRKTQAR